MRDQAEILRMKMLESQGALGKSLAIVSGKGGVGKSNFTTNFATLLVKEGKNVVILDMDIGMGNVHILLGNTTDYSLKDYLNGQVELEQVIVTGPNGLKYIAGGSGMSTVVDWSSEMFERLIAAFRQLQLSYDYILFDMGAGATNWSLDLISSIDEIIVIATAEPTAIMDAYSMMKYIHLKDEEKTFFLLCNRVLSIEEGQETLARLDGAMQKFMSKETIKLGSLPEDPVVRKAVREQVPFVISYPNAPITKTMQKIVHRFLNETTEEIYIAKDSNKLLTKLRNIFSKGRD